jgi:hypothetical protein
VPTLSYADPHTHGENTLGGENNGKSDSNCGVDQNGGSFFGDGC